MILICYFMITLRKFIVLFILELLQLFISTFSLFLVPSRSFVDKENVKQHLKRDITLMNLSMNRLSFYSNK